MLPIAVIENVSGRSNFPVFNWNPVYATCCLLKDYDVKIDIAFQISVIGFLFLMKLCYNSLCNTYVKIIFLIIFTDGINLRL